MNTSSQDAAKTAWLFDVDGVITNLDTKKIEIPEILNVLASKLKNQDIVALNTGRSFSWVKDRVLDEFKSIVEDESIFENFFLVGEKGSIWISYKNGTWKEEYDHNISIPEKLKIEIQNLAAKYKNSMFFDESKQTMISIEMHDNYPQEEYKKDQNNLLEEIKTIAQGYKDFTIRVNPIAIDIEHKEAGKTQGTKTIISWIKSKTIMPERFISFGDNPEDIEIADETYKEGFDTKFVYVGEGVLPQRSYPIHVPEGKFEKGTLEFLNSNN